MRDPWKAASRTTLESQGQAWDRVEPTCRTGADLVSQVGTAWSLPRAAHDSSLWFTLVAGVLLLWAAPGCDTIPPHSGGPQDVLAQTPVGTLGVFGTFRDGELQVRSVRWRIGSRQVAEAGSAQAMPMMPDPDEGSIRARLLDASGAVLVQRATSPASPRGAPWGDVPEDGSFGFLLDVEDPSRVAVLEVEAGEDLYRERAGSPLSVLLDSIPKALVESVNVAVTVQGRPREVLAEVYGAWASGRSLSLWADSLRIDPTRYGRGPAHFVLLASDGLAADLVYASSVIDVPFAEHLEIHFDGVGGTLRPEPGQQYLYLEPLVVRFTSPSESRSEVPFPGTVRAHSDVDGLLLDRDLSPNHPELYLDLAGLPPGPRVLTITTSVNGLRAERSVVVELQPQP